LATCCFEDKTVTLTLISSATKFELNTLLWHHYRCKS